MNATAIVQVLLDSYGEEFMDELGEIAANPTVGAIKFALERGKEYVGRPVDSPNQGGFVLDINVKPIASARSLKTGSRMIVIRWIHHSYWGNDKQGGGYFFVRPEQFKPVLEGISDLVRLAVIPSASDALMRGTYDAIIRYRYTVPRTGKKYTDTGIYAYMR